jgi:sialidase-1
MASFIRVSSIKKGSKENILAFSNPNHSSERKNMTIKLSLDEGETWKETHQKLIDERTGYGYSAMTMVNEKTLGLLYEGVRELYFVRIPLEEILESK